MTRIRFKMAAPRTQTGFLIAGLERLQIVLCCETGIGHSALFFNLCKPDWLVNRYFDALTKIILIRFKMAAIFLSAIDWHKARRMSLKVAQIKLKMAAARTLIICRCKHDIVFFLKLIHRFNPFTAKLINFNFHPLEVVSRWRDPQLQVSKNYSHLTKWRSTLFKSCWLMSYFIFNMFKRWYLMC